MFNGGTNVVLTATPQPGYRFDGWGGDSTTPGCAGTAPTVTIAMNGPRQCAAVFVPDTVSGDARLITILVDLPESDRPRVRDTETGLIDCVGTCTVSVPIENSPYRLRQSAPPGSIQDWSGCDSLVPDPRDPGGLALCEVDISQADRTIGVVPE